MTYSNINIENLSDFHDRFNNCFDGLITSISIKYIKKDRWPNVEMTLEVQDNTNENEWSYLSIKMSEVRELDIIEGNSSYRVLSDGLNLVQLDQYWGVSLDDSVEDSLTIDEFKKSPFYFICSNIQWETSNIPED